MSGPLIQIGRRGTSALPPQRDLLALREEFRASHYIRLTGFFSGELLQWLRRGLDANAFATYEHGTIARELILTQRRAVDGLHFLLNCPALFQAIGAIVASNRITRFNGRVYRMTSSADHYDSWHSDLGEEGVPRIAALSVNLGGPFAGGILQIREWENGRVVAEIENDRCGDAILFRLAPELQHRVTRVEGDRARTAYAGWFTDTSEPLPFTREALH